MKSRRNFIQKSSLIGLGSGLIGGFPNFLIAKDLKNNSPNDTINFGVIGCNGMGWSNMKSILKNKNTNCIALCDVDDSVLNKRINDAKKITGNKPKVYKDYRRMLENKDIDAVVIGTPDHWHCLNLVDTLDSGKHAYCEKPISNSIEEAQIMLNASKNSDKCVQVGQWQRSGTQYKDAIEYLSSGKLGRIRLVKAWAYMGWYGWVDTKENKESPSGIDYNMWLGPAPMRRFNENRYHFNFRWYWDYAGGLMTDWGVHEIDIALWGMKEYYPISVMASGGRFGYPDQDTETPDTLQAIYEYKNFTMIWEHANGIDQGNYGLPEGIAFIGSKGTLKVNRRWWQVTSEKDQRYTKEFYFNDMPKTNGKGNALDKHTKNFIECIRSNNKNNLNCSLEEGSKAAINAHMGNIAFRTGKKIYWNSESNSFNDTEADAFIRPKYNNGWNLPTL